MSKPRKKTSRKKPTRRKSASAKKLPAIALEVKHAGGRPSVYEKKFSDLVVPFMAQGFSLTAFAGYIEVSRDTIYEWGENIPEFSDALQRARAARTLYWERRLQLAEKDARSVIFALRNSCADEWKPDPETSVHVKNDVHVDLSRPLEEWGQAEIETELARRGAILEKSKGKGSKKNG